MTAPTRGWVAGLQPCQHRRAQHPTMLVCPASLVKASVGAGLLCAALGAPAQDLPRSPACRTALMALENAEDALVAAAAASAPDPQRQRAVAARLQPMRQRVADACLGGLTQSPPPSQRTWAAPIRPVDPARPGAAPRLAQPAVPAVSIPVPRVEAPVTVNNCNGATCLASDGSTLTRVGPNVVGPRGACRVEGVFLRCP